MGGKNNPPPSPPNPWAAYIWLLIVLSVFGARDFANVFGEPQASALCWCLRGGNRTPKGSPRREEGLPSITLPVNDTAVLPGVPLNSPSPAW